MNPRLFIYTTLGALSLMACDRMQADVAGSMRGLRIFGQSDDWNGLYR